ncbi:putative disease resistance protein At4g11170 [Prunus avium]|uniref:Disease resistance protein At4g11170 n=1 Tax=Prunus avium TaxID=42229 RepID=A0A6P5SUA9_PRUAV|nr:putative disease resistance protein At4g11170 [Prunus avium]
MEKKFFLHVACLHRGRDKEQVIETLDSILDISSRIGIDILVETSLLTVEKLHSQGNSVEMHDLIQEMAWRIVREESPEEPGKRSLLWCRKDIFHAFMNNTVTEAIEGIALRLPELEVVHWNCTEAFDKMQGLRFLEFDNVMISSAPKVLPNSLRIIRWNWYPSKSLPPRFEPCFLAKLEMCYSKLVRLWDGAKGNSVEMHDLIQEMAWRIVREESPEEPGKRSLLWCRKDIFHAFMNNTVTEAIEGIALRLPELEVVHWNCTEAFDKMQGLRFLEFDNVMISSAPKRCKRLEQLPDLPSNSFLYVDANDCTSLKRLSDPSKSSGGANMYDFIFTCLNCFSLVKEEGWINRIFAMIMRLASEGLYPMWTGNLIVCPGSEIPDWFENPSVGDSITMELPLPPQPCSDWVGIALCVVFEDSEYLENPDTLLDYDFLKIECLLGAHETLTVGHLESQHLWHFYLPCDDIKHQIQLIGKEDGSCSHRFSFKSHYCLKGSPDKFLETSSIIKKCGARLVFKRDLEEFSRILKIPKPALLDAYSSDKEAGPIGSSGSGSSDDENEPGN